MGLFCVGTGSGSQWVLWTVVVLLAAHANEPRIAQAQAFVDADATR